MLDSRILTGVFWASQVALVVKNPPTNAEDVIDASSIPGSGRSPGGGRGSPFQCTEFSRQEYWSDLPFPCVCARVCACAHSRGSSEWKSRGKNTEVFCHFRVRVRVRGARMRAYSPGSSEWNSRGKNTEVICHFFLQGIFPTQGLIPHLLCLLHCRQIFYCWTTGEANIDMG